MTNNQNTITYGTGNHTYISAGEVRPGLVLSAQVAKTSNKYSTLSSLNAHTKEQDMGPCQ